MIRGGAVYIMTNARHTVLYVGVTSNLIARVQEHKDKVYPSSFTSKYNVFKLVYFEGFHSIEEAIDREKQVKKYRREKKDALVNQTNPEWKDLFDELE
ncbi:GIY-YIG nuclease family protein [Reichenbachiella ulvae]|uniref:GIY-YIG nuclease family protein n=1 Tax=Reichenbachiella ulvae TaxID=2980104 RepID=A0ABT3CY83_9BACT|nr:GIY-YIG nuclease family protein [Reichenbachiella ulvae]MCV9388508.1 GIY-YIG nuclease family protein [Reichenbachiella ulvae]